MKKQIHTIEAIGPSRPIFLCQKSGEVRVFLDAESVSLKLQYSYDPPLQFSKNPRQVEWVDYEAGLIESDFACAFSVPPTAVRLYIKKQAHPVKLEIQQSIKEDENG